MLLSFGGEIGCGKGEVSYERQVKGAVRGAGERELRTGSTCAGLRYGEGENREKGQGKSKIQNKKFKSSIVGRRE